MSFFTDQMNEIIAEADKIAISQGRSANLIDFVEAVSKIQNEIILDDQYILRASAITKFLKSNERYYYSSIDYKLNKFVLRLIMEKEHKNINNVDIKFAIHCMINYFLLKHNDFVEFIDQFRITNEQYNRTNGSYKIKNNNNYLGYANNIVDHELKEQYVENDTEPQLTFFRFIIILIMIAIASFSLSALITDRLESNSQENNQENENGDTADIKLDNQNMNYLDERENSNLDTIANRDDNPAINVSEQKIIWQFTGSALVLPGHFQADDGMLFVPQFCRRSSENLDNYLQNGWKIVNSSSAERAVNGGLCQGRDIILQR